jgi:hypothetical protein
MLTIAYRLIVLLMLVLSTWNMFRQDNFRDQIGSVLVIIPLMLRVFMIK